MNNSGQDIGDLKVDRHPQSEVHAIHMPSADMHNGDQAHQGCRNQ